MQPAAADALSLRRYGPSPGSHSHNHFQVLFGLEGALELEIEGRGQRVAQGEGCVIGPGARHDFEAQRGSVCLVLDSTQPGWAQCLQRAAAPPSHAHPLAQYLAHALQQGRPLAQAHGPALLLEAWLAGGTGTSPSPSTACPLAGPPLLPAPAGVPLTGSGCSSGQRANGTRKSQWPTWPGVCTSAPASSPRAAAMSWAWALSSGCANSAWPTRGCCGPAACRWPQWQAPRGTDLLQH